MLEMIINESEESVISQTEFYGMINQIRQAFIEEMLWDAEQAGGEEFDRKKRDVDLMAGDDIPPTQCACAQYNETYLSLEQAEIKYGLTFEEAQQQVYTWERCYTPHNEVWKEWGNNCVESCEMVRSNFTMECVDSSGNDTSMHYHEGCFCADGYYRDETTWMCVSYDTCLDSYYNDHHNPDYPHHEACGPYEYYDSCAANPMCIEYCGQPDWQSIYGNVSCEEYYSSYDNNQCYPRCVCDPGFMRDPDTQQCVPAASTACQQKYDWYYKYLFANHHIVTIKQLEDS